MNLGKCILVLGALFSTLTVVAAEKKMIVKEWDLLFPSEEAYQEYLGKKSNKGMDLIVNTVRPNVKDIWNHTDRMKLTYCVSNDFRTKKKDVIEAIKIATEDWMSVARVKFTYVPTQHSRCINTNTQVMFNVIPVTGGEFLAAAFFPSSPRSQRILKIDASSFKHELTAISGFLRHELGHALGFRHEHIVPQSRNQCPREGTSYVPVTRYDQLSVMHYPQCGGKGKIENMVLSELDKEGARKVYP